MSRQPYARIAITLPRADLAAADRLARAHDRSRSWIIAEALRRYAAGAAATDDEPAEVGSGRRERPDPGRVTGLGASRRAQLQRDLRATPEERVRLAEETSRVDELAERAGRPQLLFFDRYEDYVDWKRRPGAGA
jgi:predicted transcriptional regulator